MEYTQYLKWSIGINIFLLIGLLYVVITLLRLSHRYQALQQTEHELNKLLLIEKEFYEVNKYREITNEIYNNVLEADITHNQLLGENSKELLKQLSLSEDAGFDQCIEKIIEKFVKEEYHDIYRASFSLENLLERYHNGEKMFTFEFIERADLVHYCWTRVTVCIYYSKVTESVKIISYVKNIQHEKEIELELKQKASTDSLTGLLNREGILQQAKEILQQKQLSIAMFMIDIDFFKEINDELGHQYGDRVLTEIGAILKEIFNERDAIGRLGGDEFMVIYHYQGDIQTVISKAKLICEKFARNYYEDNISLKISSSVGIALYPIHGKNFQDLYKNADIALYRSKQNGKNQYTLFSSQSE